MHSPSALPQYCGGLHRQGAGVVVLVGLPVVEVEVVALLSSGQRVVVVGPPVVLVVLVDVVVVAAVQLSVVRLQADDPALQVYLHCPSHDDGAGVVVVGPAVVVVVVGGCVVPRCSSSATSQLSGRLWTRV